MTRGARRHPRLFEGGSGAGGSARARAPAPRRFEGRAGEGARPGRPPHAYVPLIEIMVPEGSSPCERSRIYAERRRADLLFLPLQLSWIDG